MHEEFYSSKRNKSAALLNKSKEKLIKIQTFKNCKKKLRD